MNPLLVRVIASLAAVALFGWFNFGLNAAAPLVSGDAAVAQLLNSDAGYASSQVGMHLFNGTPVSSVLLLVLLAALWWKYLRGALGAWFGCVAAAGLLATPAFAYYDTSDRPEFVEIAPNQTAFLIPVMGANKDTQGNFMSEAYLAANKVALKRVQIPHTLIRNPGWSADYYVPAAKLIIVDRSPFNREWVAAHDRGTSGRDESFRFESGESVNISTGITISAYVKEEDTAKFLYWFGTKNPAPTPSDPAANFASVAQGRSLAEVMDSVVRGKVQAVLAREFGGRSTTEAALKKREIITIVEDEVRKTFAEKGITIDYIGYAESLTYDNPEIQKAIDNAFIAQRDSAAAIARAAALPALKALADIELERSFGAALLRWNGQVSVPNFVVLPSDVMDNLAGLLKGLLGTKDAPASAKP